MLLSSLQGFRFRRCQAGRRCYCPSKRLCSWHEERRCASGLRPPPWRLQCRRLSQAQPRIGRFRRCRARLGCCRPSRRFRLSYERRRCGPSLRQLPQRQLRLPLPKERRRLRHRRCLAVRIRCCPSTRRCRCSLASRSGVLLQRCPAANQTLRNQMLQK